MLATHHRFHHLLGLALVLVLSLLALGPSRVPISQAAIVNVRTNQLGYLPTLTKRATLVSSSATPLTWQLKDSGGGVNATGSTTVFGLDAASGDYVHIIDFSSYTASGAGLTLVVGTNVSHPFTISPTVYNALPVSALNYFYQSRSGIAISSSYVPGAQWARAAGPADTAISCATGIGCTYTLDVSKGWYDAGDHGKYVVSGGIATWTLLNQYERAKYYGSTAAYADGKLNLPEKTNGVPDILDEARWELEFILKMQVPAGSASKAGMVHNKMHDDAWTGLPLRPDQDTQPRHLHAPTTPATLQLAALGAQCSRIWQTIDATFANKCLSAAEAAWTAANANAVIAADPNDGSGGGAYPDSSSTDEFYWAAAELFVTTGKAVYQNYLTSSPLYKTVPTTFSANEGMGQLTSMTWANTAALGTIALAIVPNNLPAADIATARSNLRAAADIYIAEIARQGYQLPFKPGSSGYPWGSSSFVLNNAIILGLAYDLSGNASYLSGVVQAMDYILGRNAMDKSYVSGYGANPLQNPHHRFWANALNSTFPPPPPGVVSGGPNSGLQDSTSASLSGCAPAKCYIDNINAYSTNEVAVNWNAPLAWVAGYLNEKSSVVIAVTPVPTTPPAATATRTSTAGPGSTATATATRTNTTGVMATATRTRTPVPATATRTNTTGVMATATRTRTPVPPTATAAATTGLKVQYKEGGANQPTNNEIKPFLQVVNGGTTSVALSTLKARYWFTWEGTTQTQSYFCDYALKGCTNLTGSFVKLATARNGADYYLEVGFTSGAGSLAAGASSGEVQSRFSKSDFTPYNETGDYSFDPTKTAFADWTKVTLYNGGALVWGVEP